MPCCFSSDKPAAGRTPRAVSKNLYAGFLGMQSVRQSWTVFLGGGVCFVFLSMDTKMSTMSPFGGEAGSGEFSGVLQFEHLFAPEDTPNILFALFLISTSYTTTSSHELLFVSSLTQDQFAMGDTPPPQLL